MSFELKIKTKTLAAESKIIQSEVKKLRSKVKRLTKRLIEENETLTIDEIHALEQERDYNLVELTKGITRRANSMAEHRTNIVRKAARSTHLAYGYLRGHDYRVMENEKTRTQPDWNAIHNMVKKYSSGDSRDVSQKFEEWKSAALA